MKETIASNRKIVLWVALLGLLVFACNAQKENNTDPISGDTAAKSQTADKVKAKIAKQDKKAAEPEGPPPKLLIPEPSFHAGNIARGEKAVHTFTLKNTGKGVLHIIKAKGS